MRNEIWKQWMEYFHPNETVYHSAHNDILEVHWVNGRKVLDTRHANYSYGTLQEVLENGLDSIPLDQLQSTLVLGMGAGCVVESLRDRKYEGPILGIEIDPVIIEIAEKEFRLFKDKKVEVLEGDAGEYIQDEERTYDLIIIDLFIDTEVPAQFYKKKFWQDVLRITNSQGFVLFNAGIDLSEEDLDAFLMRLPEDFIYQIMLNVLESNTLIILQNAY